MNITPAQLQGHIRAVLAAFAGYLGAKSGAFADFANPMFIDAAAGLLFAFVSTWSHRSKAKPGK